MSCTLQWTVPCSADAYGWSDIKTDCEFLLDYEIDEEEWGNKKKPWRYRWPDEGPRRGCWRTYSELNADRAEEEARSGVAAEKKGGKEADRQARGAKASDTQDLFA